MMEAIQRLARSLRNARTVDLPKDSKAAAMVLMPMIINNQHRSVSDLLSGSSFDVNFVFGRAQRNLLHIAANCGSYEVLCILLKKGASPNVQDIAGCTPLHLAARNGKKRCMTKLLEYKADVNICNNEGLTMIHWLAVNGRSEALNDVFQYVTNVDVEDGQGQTALHVASQNGHKSTVACLLAHGAQVDKINSVGQTPLYFASSHGQVEAVRLLLDKGAKHFSDESGFTPLLKAAQGGYTNVCSLLLKAFTKLWPHLIQFSLNEKVDEAKLYTVYSKLCEESCQQKTYILEGLADLASTTGHKLLSHSSSVEMQVSGMNRCVRLLSKLYKKYFSDEGLCNTVKYSPPSTIFQPLEALWNTLEQWLLLMASELKKLPLQNTETHSCITSNVSGIPSEEKQDIVGKKTTECSNHIQKSDDGYCKVEKDHKPEDDCLKLGTKSDVKTGTSGEFDIILKEGSLDDKKIIELSRKSIIRSLSSDTVKESETLLITSDRVCAVIQAFYTTCSTQMRQSMTPPRFIEFVCRHDAVLKFFVTKNPKVIFNYFNFLLECPELMARFLTIIQAQPFSDRVDWFYENLRTREEEESINRPPTDIIYVKRDDLFTSSCSEVKKAGTKNLKKSIAVNFSGEMGVGQGLVREWFDILSKEILNPDYALFTPSADGATFQPNSNSSVNPDHLNFFHFAGYVLGLALYHHQLIDAYFTRSFYKHLLGIPVNYKDVGSLDPEYAKNLQWILDNNIDNIGLELTFSVQTDAFGVLQEVELKPGGSSITVTNSNKQEYVQLVTELRMTRAIQPQIDSFLKGFSEFISPPLLQLFNEYELELLLSGLPSIDVDDWKANTVYNDQFDTTSDVVKWFWEVVSEMSPEERVLLLQFSTGSSRVPHGGFSHLIGGSGITKFNISAMNYQFNVLPTTSTCVNMLKLPEYKSKEELKDRLLVALRCGSQGYGMA
ncbi:E3 ubiquitin-protein ligase HACE1-like [Anneissia japonica]|uniref:E3 ubiquitin-protein ligase HACE1-like n=1 Tax=Anneissia japonica TaxID=1529436 RepID=UPI0014258C91|nr:E3 ubiquitin-protein ligase HACE1-like [Anneissia japonica]